MLKNRITLEKRKELMPYLEAVRHGTSGLSFTSLYMWREENDFEYEIVGDYLCISAVSYLKSDGFARFLMPPLPLSGRYDTETLRECLLEMKKIFNDGGSDFSVRLVPESIRAEIEKAVPEMEWFDDRPNYDYIYDRKELEELKGKKFHAKKNYVNSFRKNHEYEYVDIDSSMAEEIMEFINDFTEKKELDEDDKKLLLMEEKATRDVFENFEEAGFIGGLIRVEGKTVALAACGMINGDTAVEHIEKANTDYRGLYPTMLHELAGHLPENIRYINREEDMDLENLRKAKLSFKPCKLIEKYIGKM